MKHETGQYTLVIIVALALMTCITREFSNFVSLVVGATVFTLNALLLAFVGRKLFGGRVEAKEQSGSGGGGFLLLALGLKVFGLGIGVYLSLVIFNLAAPYFVAGAGVGLLALAVALSPNWKRSNKSVEDLFITG